MDSMHIGMQNMSSFTHPHAVANLHDFLLKNTKGDVVQHVSHLLNMQWVTLNYYLLTIYILLDYGFAM